MIFVAVGANLPSPRFGSPLETCEAAVAAMPGAGMRVLGRSRWYKSAPVPVSSQPWYVNGVVSIGTDLGPEDVLKALHGIETAFGRVRAERNAARVIDLDLIAYDNTVRQGGREIQLPHPRMHERAFVLVPMADLAPDWIHPQTGRSLAEMISALPPDQPTIPIPEGDDQERASGLP